MPLRATFELALHRVKLRAGFLIGFAQEHGHRNVRGLQRKHLEKIIGEKANTPAAANNLLKKVRALLNYAVVSDYRNDNPANGIERFKEGTHHTWTEAEIAQFEKHWPLGTRERTASALALYTGQRRGDVARMTWRDIEGGQISVVQGKTGTRLLIPIHLKLKEALDAWPRRQPLTVVERPCRA